MGKQLEVNTIKPSTAVDKDEGVPTFFFYAYENKIGVIELLVLLELSAQYWLIVFQDTVVITWMPGNKWTIYNLQYGQCINLKNGWECLIMSDQANNKC